MDAIIYAIFTYLHILGAIIGAGGAFASDFVFFKSHKDKVISKDEFHIMEGLSRVVWGGLLLLIISGAVLFGMNYEVLLASSGFLAKLTIVLIIIVNGIFFHYLHIPYIENHLEHHLFPKRTRGDESDFLIFSGVISATSWMAVVAIASLKTIMPLNYVGFMMVYCAALLLAAMSAYVMMKKTAHRQELETLRKASFVLAGVVALLTAITLAPILRTIAAPDVQEPAVSRVYTAAEVATHTTNNDCWIIVSGQVFDVTAAAAHSGAFRCGQDVSENYHRNHGPVVRPQLLAFKIGDLAGAAPEAAQEDDNDELVPGREVLGPFTEESEQIMVVVEKSNNSLLLIDGATHRSRVRFTDIGFQPHGIVFAQDMRTGYSVSRDGWLVEFDLKEFVVTRWVRVGVSSRGIALTDDGKTLALGNYEPGNVIFVDTATFTIVHEISLERFVDGKTVTSRAGALVEKGNQFIVTLKDLNGVWVLDPATPDQPVVGKYWDIGGGPSLLHDGFLTPDGRYFVTAAQDTNVGWVLDTLTWEEVARVSTGAKPHTGPGAYAYDTVYVPSLGEGILTAITYGTWEVKASIVVDGPGLFVRSYNRNPEYPYIWGDTAFYEGADTIYIIDARTQSVVEELVPTDGALAIHPEFTVDGKFVYVSVSGGDEVVVYDALNFTEITRIPSYEPAGVFNVGLRVEEPGL